MKKYLTFFVCVLVLGCYRDYEDHYEPLYLNETSEDVLFIWADPEVGWSDSLEIIHSKDTAYCRPGGQFPHMKRNGLHWDENDALYNVRLVFLANPVKCLNFEGDEFLERDVRRFSSYENIGPCDFCVERAMSTPDGMLYRITEDLLERAEPCE